MLKKYRMALVVFIIGISGLLYAEEGVEDNKKTQVKGVEIVPETGVTVLKKLNAFFTGDLEWTMPTGKDIYKDEYTFDPQGRRIPRATLGKYDSGVR